MTREILFRGKRLDNGEWVEGYYVCSKGNINKNIGYILPSVTSISVEDNCIKIGGFVAVDYDTVCRYTGLTDENGVKIFEGDIIRNIYTCDVSEVIYKKYQFLRRDRDSSHLLSFPYGGNSFEVIGNIHDTRNCGNGIRLEDEEDE